MANSKSADKRARQNKKRYELKHAQRSMVRTSVKATAKAVETKAVSYTHLTLPTIGCV